MGFVDWLASRLVQAGTRFAFGVPGGGSSLDLLQALRQRDVQLVLCAREDAAVIMAGVTGMLAGAPGVAFSTKGPGLASASNGLACAALDRLPALLVAEAFEAGELAYVSHQVFDQQALTAPLLEVSAGRMLRADVDSVQAWIAQHPSPPRGPAVLLASGAEHAARAAPQPMPEHPPVVLDSAALDAAQTMLRTARRPVVVIGLEASRGVEPARVLALAEALGAPVLCTYMAKGVVPDVHPQWAGIFTGGAIEQPCVNEADLILSIGLDPVELIRKPWSYAAPVLDLCEQVHRRHYFEPAVRLCAPLDVSLSALAGDLDASNWGAAEIDSHRRHFTRGMTIPPGEELDATGVVLAAVAAFKGHPRLSVDAGAHMFSACAFWPCAAPLDLLISNGLATMGFAVPAAIASALHDPARGALAMTGDGGLMMCLGELKTAAQTGAQVCIIVFNDGRLSLIDIKREDRQLPDLGMSWQPPDFAAVARGLGLSAWRVDSPDQLQPTLVAASAQAGPRLVDVRIDSQGYREQLKQLRG